MLVRALGSSGGFVTFRYGLLTLRTIIREYRLGLELSREAPDEGLHGAMHKSVETKEVHFVHRLFGGPAVKRHAVRGNKHTGSVLAESAVDINLFFRVVAE